MEIAVTALMLPAVPLWLNSLRVLVPCPGRSDDTPRRDFRAGRRAKAKAYRVYVELERGSHARKDQARWHQYDPGAALGTPEHQVAHDRGDRELGTDRRVVELLELGRQL